MSTENEPIQTDALKRFTSELFQKAGMEKEGADWFARTVVQANLWGIDSHGVMRVESYCERIACGAINPRPRIRVRHPAPAVALLDGDGAAGCVAAGKGMECAIVAAKQFGIGYAGVANSNHFGAAAFYTRMAVDAGMLGIAMTNVTALMAAPGAKGKVVGNNPLSIGIPTYADYPFLLDMSLSVAAEGKLRLAVEKGESIPSDWAVDADGKPTTDPAAALKGFLLPVGGFKGLGLAYAVDILSGVITGGAFADGLRSMYKDAADPSLTGHAFIAVNLDAFIDREEMRARMRHYHEYIQSFPLAENAPPLCFPGEIEHRTQAKRLSEGIPLPAAICEKLDSLAQRYGVHPLVDG